MKNTYSNITFSIMSAAFVLSMFTQVSYAASFEPTGRTYYPAGNTQPITIVNNNYNNNANANTAPRIAQAPAVYTAPAPRYTAPSGQRSVNVQNIAQRNLSRKGVTKLTTRASTGTSACTDYNSSSYRLVKEFGCGATVAIAGVKVPKPTCSLAPALTARGAIELQWTTAGATVAYLDNGIGHVNTMSGKRIVTPSKNTAYNLTVLNDAGIASSCGAKVNVSLAQAGTVNVIANNANYTYSLNGNTQSVSVSTATVTDGTTQDNSVNTAKIDNADTNGQRGSLTTTDTNMVADEVSDASTSILSKIFGDSFKKVAIPIGITFLILIVLLMFIMSKVKGAK